MISKTIFRLCLPLYTYIYATKVFDFAFSFACNFFYFGNVYTDDDHGKIEISLKVLVYSFTVYCFAAVSKLTSIMLTWRSFLVFACG